MVTPRALRQAGRLKVFLVAGEASGDAYGALLIRELQQVCNTQGLILDLVGWGGDGMHAEGMRLLTHCASINFMGFLEVAQNLPTILQNLKRAEADVVREDPDLVLTIDFPGFNLRLAKALRQRQHSALRVQWVAPQVWAWKAGRVAKLREDFDAVAPILPFEAANLEAEGVNVWNLGHPLLDLVPQTQEDARPIGLALLPGSRMQELKHHLPILIDAALEGAMQGLWSMNEVVVAGAPGRTESDYALAREQGIRVVFGETHRILAQAKRAWVASGTATLEAALLNTPHVLVYKTSWVTYHVAKRLAKVKFIGLPNILLNRTLVPELIQHDLTPSNLLSHTSQSLEGQQRGFSELQSQLGGPCAARRLAQQMLEAFTKESGSET